MAKRAKAKSPAYKLVEYVRQNSNTTAWVGHEGDGLNQVLARALALAIRSGMRFDLDDFRRIRTDFWGSYWYGGDSDEVKGEHFYSRAVRCGNESACRSFEEYAGRLPFKLETGKRVGVGDEVPWLGARCEVTSFRDGCVVLCAYSYEGEKCRRKLKKRHTVSHEAWCEEMKLRKQRRKPPPVNTVVTLPEDGEDYVVSYSCGGRRPEVCLVSVERSKERPLGPARKTGCIRLDVYWKACPSQKLAAPDMRKCTTAVDRDGNVVNVKSYTEATRDSEMVLELEMNHCGYNYWRLTYSAFLAEGFKLVEDKRKKGGC